jgi:hypothetical protein
MDEDLDVKKPRSASSEPYLSSGGARRGMLAMSELFRGLSLASADAWRAFSNAIDPERRDDRDLLRSFSDGLAAGNRRYFDTMAETSRRLSDVLIEDREETAAAVANEIDYERLARLVADELRKAPDAADVTRKGASDTAG